MRQIWLLSTCACLLGGAILLARRAESGQTDSLVRLQQSTPGVTQVGNSNVSGTSKAGQFVGGGAGITGINATNIATGTLGDARLSPNVALENVSNLFTASNQFNGFVGINRSNLITSAEMFGIQGPSTGFGGMYISSTGAAGQPFYGYSLPGVTAYHYLDGNDGNKWKLQMPGGLAVTVKPTGEVGVGTSNPVNKLDVIGTVSGVTSNGAASGVVAGNTGGGTALYASTGSSGRAAQFQVTGATNPTYALDATHAGSGIAIKGYMTGTGMAGHFQIANASNTIEALHAETNGSGSAIYAQTATGGTAIFAIRTANGNKGWLGGLNEGGWAESAAGDGFVAKSSGTARSAVYAEMNSTNGYALNGNATQSSGTAIGVFGQSASINGFGAYFKNTGGGVACRVEGNCKVNQLEIVGAGDVAERFEVTDSVQPGMLVSIDPDDPGKLQLCRGKYSPMVAGVVSGANRLRPGVLLDPSVDRKSLPVAMSGRVWVYCDGTDSAIEPGNLLTASNTPGYAMSVKDYSRAQGAIIGKAMTRLAKGQKGLVLAIVSLQ